MWGAWGPESGAEKQFIRFAQYDNVSGVGKGRENFGELA